MKDNWIALDIETKSPDKDKPDLALDFTQAQIISMAWWSPKVKGATTDPEVMKRFLTEYLDAKWVTHGGKFDAKIIGQSLGLDITVGWDTLLAESLLPDRPLTLDLETCVAKELGYPQWKTKRMYRNMGAAKQEDVIELNLIDTEYTYRLFLKQYERFEDLGLLKYYLESPLGVRCYNFLKEIETRGMGFDYTQMQALWKVNLEKRQLLVRTLADTYTDLTREYTDQQLKDHPLKEPVAGAKAATVEKFQERLRARQAKYAFNFASDKQVLWLLRDKLGFPCINLEGKASTGKDVLEFYRGQHPIIDPLLELRHIEHDANSFFSNWEYYNRNNRLHPSYNMTVAKTFRLSCSDPALQQVPRGSAFRELFIPKPGCKFMVIDYSQVEPRLIAQYSKDPELRNIYTNHLSLYHVVAQRILGYKGTLSELKTKDKFLYAVAKKIALSSFYGIGPDKFAYDLRVETGQSITSRQAREYLQGYFDLLSGVRAFKQQLSQYLEQCPEMSTFLGRKLYFKPNEYYHLAFNKIIQNSGSDLTLHASVEIDQMLKQMGMVARCVHLVHDEAIYEYPPEEESKLGTIVQYMMADRYNQAPFNLEIPIEVDIKTGQTWACK